MTAAWKVKFEKKMFPTHFLPYLKVVLHSSKKIWKSKHRCGVLPCFTFVAYLQLIFGKICVGRMLKQLADGAVAQVQFWMV